ncbi:MAG: twin-arginine translocase subunit TatC [Bacteroidetes bacterium]|nr:twin-arginine translocase subunit TatC [Rhodothermia bacterium]MCS7154802.1 twin-arginine translocase subunit TatC [Bacteroidota bacterium]MCX7907041.1 twin-arginine translocase subunit TatC [Bacteroidota bacterium]MDW8137595.1 twin-arginine translocase subunit TatC [Bacteroidota bacterium]MDW8285451.1 twin-arginine translocase subunit TatC [Bacteroidota bacterium]
MEPLIVGRTEEPARSRPSAFEEPSAEMSFWDHLEELRWRLIKGLSGLLAGVVLVALFADWVMHHILLGPARADFFMYRLLGLEGVDLALQNRRLPGQFVTYWGTILLLGAILGSPVLIYQLWAFIKPGLYPHERRAMRWAVGFVSLCFLLGAAFGYLVLMPAATRFFARFQIDPQVQNIIDINTYFGMMAMLVIASGLLFEMPVLAYFLSKIGLLSPQLMRRFRRHAYVAILILSGVLTPSPDPFTQTLLAVPLVALYETSIGISSVVAHRRQRELERLAYGASSKA